MILILTILVVVYQDYLNKNDLEIESDLVAIADRALEYMKIARKESKTVLDAMGGLFFKGWD